MRNRLTRLASLALGFGLVALVLVPETAHALLVQCADETGDCEVSNDGFDSISCSCANDSAFGGTGGEDWVNLSEDELMEVCLSELAFCSFGETETGVDTFGDTGWSDSGWVDTGDWGSDTGWTDTGDWGTDDWGSDTFGDTGSSDTIWGDSGFEDSGSSDSGGSDTGTSTDEGDSTSEGDSGTSTDEGDSTSESSSGSESGDEAESTSDTGESDTGDGAGVEEDAGCNCATTSSPGVGLTALLGLFGLLRVRPRRRD